jgi:outer membrane protein assembly factor BamB
MRQLIHGGVIALGGLVLCMAALVAQGRPAANWPTTNGDAQRTGWIPTDSRISAESMKSPGFQFLWKLKLAHLSPPADFMTAPVLFPTLSTFRGRKSIAVLGGSGNDVYAIDADLGRLFWSAHFNYAAAEPEAYPSVPCPRGITSGLSRPTLLTATTPWRASGAAQRKNVTPPGSAVGEPGLGAAGVRRSPAVASGTAPAASAPVVRAAAPEFGDAGLFVTTGDGLLHALNPQTGADVAPAVPFLPPNATAGGLIAIDGVAYASTLHGCGGVLDALWSLDMSTSAVSANDAPIAGVAGATFSPDGTLFVATSDGSGRYANSIVSLEPGSLRLRNAFTRPNADFNATPVFFTWKGRDYVAAGGSDGRVYLLQASTLGGADHHTPVFVTPPAGSPSSDAGMLASWEDAAGRRWILVPTARHVVAFTVAEANGVVTLETAWTSRELASPLSPIIINGVVFVVSNGSTSAALFAMDGLTGQELWNSGSTITSPASGGLTGALNQVMFPTRDGTFWAFGFPTPH